jgi:hypothetical protein
VTAEIRERVRRYYTAYYRDTLAIPDWRTLVELRLDEEQRLEAPHVERVRRLLSDGLLLLGNRARALDRGLHSGRSCA